MTFADAIDGALQDAIVRPRFSACAELQMRSESVLLEHHCYCGRAGTTTCPVSARSSNVNPTLGTRAIYHDAACAECYDTYALLSFEKGDVALALRARAIAVNLFSEHTVPALSERLRIYREAISKSASLPGASRNP